MRTLPFLVATMAVIVAAGFTSCRPSRVYANNKHSEPAPPPPPAPARTYSSFSLIINPTPGFIMKRYPDGRYYHRNQAGMLYWRGYDNRFYLDRSYIHRVRYSQWEYNQWRKYSGSQGNYQRRR